MKTLIALWAHPRSRSTALERVFMERGDFQVFHEPFSFMHYSNASTLPHEDLNCGYPITYEGIKAMILEKTHEWNVFHKDMPYHCLHDLISDHEFLLCQKHVFIIRDPLSALQSYHSLYPDMPRESGGYDSLYEIFRIVNELTKSIPYVINAEYFAQNPESTIKSLCEHLDIEFLPHSLNWKKRSPEQWQAWKAWHKDAEESTCISKSIGNIYSLENLNRNPSLYAYYEYHLPFYERLNHFAIQA